MQTVRIFHLKKLSSTASKLVYEGEKEAARLWNFCCATHKTSRESKQKWPNRNSLQELTKQKFALHSQSVQMVCHAFLANIDTAVQIKKNKQTDPSSLQGKEILSTDVAKTSSYMGRWSA